MDCCRAIKLVLGRDAGSISTFNQEELRKGENRKKAGIFLRFEGMLFQVG